jgi:hypothetical protein
MTEVTQSDVTAGPANTADSSGDEADCWCCGQRYPNERLVRLGSHPEVAVCAVRALSASASHAPGRRAAAVDREPASGRAALGPPGGDGPPLASAAGDRPAVALARPLPALTSRSGGERVVAGGRMRRLRRARRPVRPASGGRCGGCALSQQSQHLLAADAVPFARFDPAQVTPVEHGLEGVEVTVGPGS